MMRSTKVTITIAAAVIIVLSLCSILSIVLDDGGNSYPAETIRGEIVTIYGGLGPYRFDSLNKAVMFRGFDIANLVFVVPFAAAGLVLLKRRRIPGSLILESVFGYLVYDYFIGVAGNAFNEFFLVWIGLVLLGAFGLMSLVPFFKEMSRNPIFGPTFPKKTFIVYLLVLAGFLFFSYLWEVLRSYLFAVPPPALEHYTTLELAAIELIIMVPLHILAVILLLKDREPGKLLAVVLSFTAFMTFAALCVYQLLLVYQYQMADLAEILPLFVFMILSGLCTASAFKAVRGGQHPPVPPS